MDSAYLWLLGWLSGWLMLTANSALTAWYAGRVGRNVGLWFALPWLLTPFAAWVILLALPNRRKLAVSVEFLVAVELGRGWAAIEASRPQG